MAASHPSSTCESHDRIQAAYDATRAELAALGNDQLLAVNVQVVHAVTTVLGALPALRALRPQIARHLPTFDLERFDKLQQYGLALLYAHAVHRARPEVPDGIAELGQEVKQLRDRLFLNAECLAQHGLLDGRPLQGCKRGRSHRALAGDVFTLVALFTASWDHVPRARLQEFFACFHRKLSAGAVVVFGDNKKEGGTPDSDGNLYQDRTLPGGALRAGEQRVPGREAMKYRVIKNWLRIEELRALLAPWTDTVELQEFERDWFVCYSLRG